MDQVSYYPDFKSCDPSITASFSQPRVSLLRSASVDGDLDAFRAFARGSRMYQMVHIDPRDKPDSSEHQEARDTKPTKEYQVRVYWWWFAWQLENIGCRLTEGLSFLCIYLILTQKPLGYQTLSNLRHFSEKYSFFTSRLFIFVCFDGCWFD